MSDCIDTIQLSRPLEGLTTWFFQGVLWCARRGDLVLNAVVAAGLTARERVAQRHLLSGLDERMLADLGLSRADVEREIGKPFWRA